MIKNKFENLNPNFFSYFQKFYKNIYFLKNIRPEYLHEYSFLLFSLTLKMFLLINTKYFFYKKC